MDHTTHPLVEFASRLTYPALSAKTIEAATARILGTPAVSLAAFEWEPVRIVRKLAQPATAGPAASLFGSRLRTTRRTWPLL